MAGEQISNSVRAGVFVLTCIALAAAVGLTLKRSSFFQSRDQYFVRFTLADGVAGLAQGSDVQIGGLSRGRVLEVKPEIDADTGNVTELMVRIELDSDIRLYEGVNGPDGVINGPRVIRVASPLGNTATLNFVSIGVPRTDARGKEENLLPPRSIIDATSGSGLLASIVGAENASQVGAILRNVANFSHSLDANGSPAMADLQSVLSRFSADYEVWRANITSSLANADSALARVDGYLSPKAQVEVFLDDAVDTASAAKSVMVQARDVSMPKVEKILDEAISAAGRLDETLGQVQAEFVAAVPQVRGFLFNAREAATQLKLGTLEVRRNPWRIFNKDGPDAEANANLYQAAADFAMATSDLSVTTESLRAVLADDRNRFTQDPQFRSRLENEVLRATDRFEAARQKLGEILQASPRALRSAP